MPTVAEDRAERGGAGGSSQWGGLISAQPSDGFDTAQAPIRQKD